MDRRSMLKLSLLGIGGALTPTLVTAKDTHTMAGGLYYTKENPGRWAKKVGSHFPIMEKLAGGKIKVTTSHPMNNYKHYIVKHMLLDNDFNFLAENLFDPTKDKVPMSTFDIGPYKGQLHVLSVCNKHDTWMNNVSI